MSNTIRNKKQFNAQVPVAFQTEKDAQAAKECYEFAHKRGEALKEELCEFAVAHADEVFEPGVGNSRSRHGTVDGIEYTMTEGVALERVDGGDIRNEDFVKTIPKKYLRVKLEVNKAAIKAAKLTPEQLAKLGLCYSLTHTMKFKATENRNERK